MEINLAGNILALRRQHGLTQEQLAEVLGVSVGAVYQWEAGLSLPELDRIVELADFFDTSVDVLLGYQMKDNSLDATVKRLRDYRRSKDRAGLAEAEKALKKYPHSFKIVNASAALYRAFGFESGDKALFHRALELLEQSLLLLSQNEDPQISEQTIYGRIAETYLGLDEPSKAIELWKAHNAGGQFTHQIGSILAQNDHVEEAIPFLSEALTKLLSDLINTIVGYMNVYMKRRDYASAQAILSWGVGILRGLREGDKPNYFDRVGAVLQAALAASQYLGGQHDEARDTLIKARELAAFFDAAPSYDESDIRFITRIEGASAHDDLGATAMGGVARVVNQFESEGLTALWKSINEQEERHG